MGLAMPLVYKCRGCGKIIYHEAKGNICSPMDIVGFHRKCPNCGRDLGSRVEVRVHRVEL